MVASRENDDATMLTVGMPRRSISTLSCTRQTVHPPQSPVVATTASTFSSSRASKTRVSRVWPARM